MFSNTKPASTLYLRYSRVIINMKRREAIQNAKIKTDNKKKEETMHLLVFYTTRLRKHKTTDGFNEDRLAHRNISYGELRKRFAKNERTKLSLFAN